MSRPRRLNVDTVMGFNCSYSLKVALVRTAEIVGQESPSSLMRRVMEDHCRQVLGPEQWHEIAAGESSQERKSRLFTYFTGRQTRRLRDALAAGGNQDVLLAELSLYAQEFEQARDDRQMNLTLRVALYEVIDVLLKITAICKRGDFSKKSALLLKLTQQLAEPLQKDVDAGVRALIAGTSPARRKP